MKKIITLTVLVLCICSYGYGQQNVYGGDFEHWKYNTNGHYYDPDSSLFSTLDTLNTVGAGITAYPCVDTVHGGTYSVGLITGYIASLQILIPGVIGTLKTNWNTGTAILGVPYPYGSALPR